MDILIRFKFTNTLKYKIMKTKISLLFISVFFAINSYSQNVDDLITKDTLIVRKLSDSIAFHAKRQFVYSNTVNNSKYQHYYSINYKEKIKSEYPIYLSVVFKVDFIGANSALEIDGTPEYRLEWVEGTFLDLFPFWKKYLDISADSVTLSTDNDYEHNRKNVVFNNGLKGYYKFYRSGGYWKIYFNESQSNIGNKI